MKIMRLELYKYKRVKLSNIEHLIYTPQASIQIILSANGSGKSSLMSQLSPLPADMKDFEDGGYKKIIIDHHTNTYELHSGVTSRTKYNFIKDGKELNDGGTKRVQLELVKQHFKLTPHIHNILLGYNNFTNMAPTERKKWLTEISDIDYSYSIKFYNSLKARHRDVVGGIKLLQDNIVHSEDLLLSKEVIAKKNENIKQLNKFIDYLLSLTKHNVGVPTNGKELLASIDSTNKEATKLLSTINNTDIDMAEVDSKIGGLNNAIDTIKNNIATITTELNNYSLNKKHSVDRDNLLLELKQVKNKEAELKGSLSRLNGIDNIELVVNIWNGIYTDLIGTISALKEFSSVNASSKEISALKARYDILNADTNRIENRLKILVADDKHFDHLLNEDNNVTCPKCKTSWYLNYDKHKHAVIKDALVDMNKKYLINKKELGTIEADIEVIDNKLKLIANLRDMVRNTNSIASIWKILLNNVDIHQDGVIELDIQIEYINTEITTLATLSIVNKKIIEITADLDKISAIDKAILANNETMITNKENELIELKKQLNIHTINIDKLNSYKAKMNSIKTVYNKLKTKLIGFDKTRIKYMDSYRNKYILDLVNGFKNKLLELEDEIRASNTVISKLESDKKQLEEYSNREKVLKIMMKELSPSEGLIAKSINSFLYKFVSDMNYIINLVWSYKLELLPSEIEDGNDLDYKFKFKIDNGDIVDDVSRGSSGMREIFDLAFKIVFMRYLGIEDAPLMLDEFGKTFDNQHQIKAYDTVDKILTSSFTQIFIISHFQSMYGRFVNADITVLNSDNIELAAINDDYNKVFKYS